MTGAEAGSREAASRAGEASAEAASGSGGPGGPGHGGPGFPSGGYLGLPLGGFLGALSARSAAPGGGSAAALSVALGAGLCTMTARLSARQLTGERADELSARTERLAERAASLIQADAESYQNVLTERRQPADGAREDRIAAALAQAAAVPMQIAETGAEIAGIAAGLAADGHPGLRGDAATAALLAEAGARAAAVLVRINLAGAPDDDRPARADLLAGQAARSSSQACQAAASRHQAGR